MIIFHGCHKFSKFKFKDIQGVSRTFFPFFKDIGQLNSRIFKDKIIISLLFQGIQGCEIALKSDRPIFLIAHTLLHKINTPHWSRFQKSSHTLRFLQILSAILFKSAIFLLLHILTATGIIFSRQLFEMCWFFHWKTKMKNVSFFEGVVSNANKTYRKTLQA